MSNNDRRQLLGIRLVSLDNLESAERIIRALVDSRQVGWYCGDVEHDAKNSPFLVLRRMDPEVRDESGKSYEELRDEMFEAVDTAVKGGR